MPQLTLDLYRDQELNFASFLAGPNGEAEAALRAWSEGLAAPTIYLWGATGCGKSHLLQSAISAFSSTTSRAMYLPLRAILGQGPQLLEGLETLDALAIDDIDAAAGQPDWEIGLFNLYNALAARQGRLLWSSQQPRTQLFQLPDLASRLSAGLVYQLHELDDTQKSTVLKRKARLRGLDLSDPVVEFILRRNRRDLRALSAVLERLDDASLRDRRPLTIPFVREVLSAEQPLADSSEA